MNKKRRTGLVIEKNTIHVDRTQNRRTENRTENNTKRREKGQELSEYAGGHRSKRPEPAMTRNKKMRTGMVI